ncbi:Prefoldin subunit-domain-containing protein [Cadophora sp. MPI-SDFR-AT-0126]|nr:Prefoldin subunit-domain-containing protein [Leotiomycetes sp. MPI-SDFR-AT-0126]
MARPTLPASSNFRREQTSSSTTTSYTNMAQQITQKKQQELQQQYTNYKNGLQQIASKIGDVESEAEEHKLVLETLEPLPGDRKCFRMINGVLVERTVKDVVPALKTNSEGLKKVLEDLVKQYNSKQMEMEKWKKKNNIQVVQQ